MHFSFLKKVIAWGVYFFVLTVIGLPLSFAPIPWVSAVAVYPAYYLAIKFGLLDHKYRKTQFAFWMPATLNMLAFWLVTNIFAPAFYRLFAPIFMWLPEEMYYVWPIMCVIPVSFIVFLIAIPSIPEWLAEDAHSHGAAGSTDGEADATEGGDAQSGSKPRGRSFLNKYTAADENPPE